MAAPKIPSPGRLGEYGLFGFFATQRLPARLARADESGPGRDRGFG